MHTLDIVILHQNWIRAQLLPWALQMVPEAQERGYSLGFQAAASRPVCQNRNEICAAFLERGTDILMMVDADMMPQEPPWDLCDLMMAGNGHDIISYMSPAWKPKMPSPVFWVAAREDDQGRFVQDFDFNGQGVMPMDAVGSGVILIHRRVLEHPDMQAPFMDTWTPQGTREIGHDYQFCIRARKAGFGVYVAADHLAAHMREIELLDVAKIIGRYEREMQYRNEQIRALGGEPLGVDSPILGAT